MGLLETTVRSYKPFHYPWAYEAWKTQQQIHWLPEEVPLGEDVKDWQKNLTAGEKNLLTQIFRFFTQADTEVANCYMKHYSKIFKPTEICMMLTAFSNMECFDKETELLTSTGWKKCPDVTMDDKVAQYDLNTTLISFVNPDKVVSYTYKGKMHHYKSYQTDICVTPNHDLIVRNNKTGNIDKQKSEDNYFCYNYSYPVATSIVSDLLDTFTGLDLLFCWIMATGGLVAGGTLINEREQYCIKVPHNKGVDLLSNLGIDYEIGDDPYISHLGRSMFKFYLPQNLNTSLDSMYSLEFIQLEGLSPSKASCFREWYANDLIHSLELYYFGSNSVCDAIPNINIVISTLDKIQAISTLAGYGFQYSIGHTEDKETEKVRKTINFTFNKDEFISYPHLVNIDYDDNVYCVSVPTQNLVSRRNNKVAITGNTVHIDAYSHLLDTVGMPDSEYSAFLSYKEMKDKYDYMQTFDVNSMHDIAKTLAAFGAFTEGVQLFASFAILMNFPRFGKMKGMGQIISWSIRDEGLHTENIIKLFHAFIEEHPKVWNKKLKDEIEEVAKTIVRNEDAFIDLAFQMGNIEGLTKEEVKQYIRYIADRRLIQLKMSPIFKVKDNPLPWMEILLGGVEYTNFFEQRATEYSKAATQGTWEDTFRSHDKLYGVKNEENN